MKQIPNLSVSQMELVATEGEWHKFSLWVKHNEGKKLTAVKIAKFLIAHNKAVKKGNTSWQ